MFSKSQAFILPLPHIAGQQAPEAVETGTTSPVNIKFLQALLEKLRAKKISWEEFFAKVPPTDTDLRLAATKEGNTILHLAALQGVSDLPAALANDSHILRKRNGYGFTPQELRLFLTADTGRLLRECPGVCIEDQDLRFFPHPVFENESTLHHILFHSMKAKEKDLIAPEKTWMGIYFDKEIQQGFHPSVSIRFIDPEVGFGVFAGQRISSCSYVGEYTGMIREKKRRSSRNKMYCVRFEAWSLGGKKFLIDAEKGGNFTRFINHSASPNLSLQSVYWRGMPRMIFIALKEIDEGTQLTFDYGNCFWKECRQTPRVF